MLWRLQWEPSTLLQVVTGTVSWCHVLNQHYLLFFLRPLSYRSHSNSSGAFLSLIHGTSQAAHWLKMCRATRVDTQQLGRNTQLLRGTFHTWYLIWSSESNSKAVRYARTRTHIFNRWMLIPLRSLHSAGHTYMRTGTWIISILWVQSFIHFQSNWPQVSCWADKETSESSRNKHLA